MKFSSSTFLKMLPDNSGYMVAFWELEPVTPEWESTGRIAVYFQTLGHHRIIFLEPDSEGSWTASGDCEGIAEETITWMGEEAERHFSQD